MVAALLVSGLGAQPPGGRAGAPRSFGPDPLALDDHTGFDSIFDGTMKAWDGDPGFWRADGGTLIGETTNEKPLPRNTFLVWRGGSPADFELKLEYRINATNSGVQYRSVELPDAGKWVMKGYQADIDYQNNYTGQLYEERGRGFLALRGQMARIEDGKKARVAGNIKNTDDAKGIIRINDWNLLHIIARGNILIHILNGQVTSVVIDDDAKNRAMSGLIGFQLHMGPPMKVEYRNVLLRKL
ncbi:MAG: 3-keto-disaccharide hydrolase [Bryobacteraceae bacterium]